MSEKQDKKGKKAAKGTKPEAKATEIKKVDGKFATKLFSEISAIEGVTPKPVGNGTGLWVGTARIAKQAKSGFDSNVLLFPRDPIKEMVKTKKLNGIITPKNVAAVPVTGANYGALLKGIKVAIEGAVSASKTKAAKKKAKAVEAKKAKEVKSATPKSTPKKEERAKRAAAVRPTAPTAAVAASAVTEMLTVE